MKTDAEKGKKTTKDHWDKGWKKKEGGGIQKITRHSLFPYFCLAYNYRLNLLFKKHLRPGGKRLLDIGCGSGRWLVYFCRKFGFEIYGIDYSQKGCELAKKTLRINNVKGEVTCTDIFDSSFQSQHKEYFDVVMSMGVVEHFVDPTEIIGVHLKLLKRGGDLIITIPNYGDGSFYRRLMKIFNCEQELLATHNVEMMNIVNFAQYLEKFNDLEIQMLDYIGPLSIGTNSLPVVLQRLLLPLDQLIAYTTLFLRSKTFSPGIVLIGRKL